MREMFRSNKWCGFGLTLAVLALVLNLSGSGRAVEGAPQSRGKLDAKSVEQWADETFGRILAEHRISALAISVTQGDAVIFKKGYGYADWAARTPVNPDTSQFRIASLSKTFIVTAIAQLLERGK